MDNWPQTFFVTEDRYSSYEEYQQELKEAEQHYGYSEKVEGGYVFFEYSTDHETWKAQK